MNLMIGTISKPRWLITFLVLASLLLVVLIWMSLAPVDTIRLSHDPDCDLRTGACETRLPDGGKISFSIMPRSIPLLKPLQLEVTTGLVDVKRVDVTFNGVDMNMGFNQIRLQKNNNGVYQGTADLSVCIRNAMEWEALVIVRQGGRSFQLPYRFITVKNSAAL